MSHIKKFFKKHEYPGGNKSLISFVKKNLNYPKEAVANKIEGVVFLQYKISEDQKIVDIKIIKGVGFGCDEEAKRIVSLLDYSKPKNRGFKISSTKKIKIAFKLPKQEYLKVKYNYISK